MPADPLARPLGGSETALLQVARRLAARGHHVCIAAHPQGGEAVHEGVTYSDVATNGWRREPFDITIVFRQLTHSLRHLPGRVKVLWAHDHIGIYPELRPGIRRVLLTQAWALGHRLFGRSISNIVAVSDWLRRCFVEFARWPASAIWTVPNAVDPSLYAREPGHSQTGRGSLKVAYTSVPERGLELLISRIMPAVWRQLPNLEVHVFSYQALSRYQYLLGSAGQVIFRGGLPQAQLSHELRNFDLWLYPTNFPETSCIAAMEAQAAGLPVITSNRFALRETVADGETGVLIDGEVGSSEYVSRFAAATLSLLRNQDLRHTMGERGKERVLRRFTWDRVASEWEQLLETLCHHPRAGQ